jgi:hypothetical protein
MSYLSALRMHFAGEFMAAPSTINNSVSNFQRPQSGDWNPNGDHRFTLKCPVTSIHYGDGTEAAARSDPALTLVVQSLTGAGVHHGKIVDLDPQEQSVSMIFGLEITVVPGGGGAALLRGKYAPAAIRDLWQRRPPGGDGPLACAFQSVIEAPVWGTASKNY